MSNRLQTGGRIEALETAPARPAMATRLAKGLTRFITRKPLGAVGAFMVISLIFVAIFAPALAPYDPVKALKGVYMEPPSLRFPFGTDQLGRDMLSRVIFGARVSIAIGFSATFLAVGGATIVGLISGFYGGKLDLIVQRAVDIVQAFPGLILAMALVAIFGMNIPMLILVLAIVPTPSMSRVVRGNVLSVKENTYIEAARVVGCGDLRILRLHILPNIFPVIIILFSIELGAMIVKEASLSFLGLGVQPPTPSWGQMISGAGRTYMLTHPWLALFPGVALSIAVLGFNFFGDAVRDILDPRMRGAERG